MMRGNLEAGVIAKEIRITPIKIMPPVPKENGGEK